MNTIRTLFSRIIDRPIEKVIDYAAEDDPRLSREIGEYEVTDNVEACFRKFLEHFGTGVRTGPWGRRPLRESRTRGADGRRAPLVEL